MPPAPSATRARVLRAGISRSAASPAPSSRIVTAATPAAIHSIRIAASATRGPSANAKFMARNKAWNASAWTCPRVSSAMTARTAGRSVPVPAPARTAKHHRPAGVGSARIEANAIAFRSEEASSRRALLAWGATMGRTSDKSSEAPSRSDKARAMSRAIAAGAPPCSTGSSGITKIESRFVTNM
jgi:hypothetical protein